MSRRPPILRGLRVPRPPAELERAVLAAALAAGETAAPEHWIDRLWASRRLRLAWLVTVVVLALVPGRLPVQVPAPPTSPSLPVYGNAEATPELPELRSLLEVWNERRESREEAIADGLARLERLDEVRRAIS